MSAPWAISNFPSTATQATVSQAYPATTGTGLVTRLRALQFTVAAGATAQTPLEAVVRDGASGTGTIIASFALAAPANSACVIALSDLDLRASPNNALTVEFTGGGVTASQESVSAQGDLVPVGYPAFADARY